LRRRPFNGGSGTPSRTGAFAPGYEPGKGTTP